MTDNFTTSQSGAPLASDEHSLTVGPDGSTVLHDRFLVEKLAAFNRERVPERNPHAKGGGAFGEFQVTEDVYRRLRSDFAFERRGEIEVKGKGRLITYLLVGRQRAS